MLLSAFDLKNYNVQINVCRYLKKRGYYLDSLIVSKVLKKNCSGYYDGLVRRNALLRVLYDFDYISYECLQPMMILASKCGLITPAYFVQNISTFRQSDELLEQCPLSNILAPPVYAFAQTLPIINI